MIQVTNNTHTHTHTHTHKQVILGKKKKKKIVAHVLRSCLQSSLGKRRFVLIFIFEADTGGDTQIKK